MRNIKDSQVLVTGGAGCLGSTIVDLLLEENPSRIDVLDDLSEGNTENLEHLKSSIVNGYLCDLSKPEEVECLIGSGEYDYVIHCAGYLFLKAQDQPMGAIHSNIIGTYNVLNEALKSGVKKVVFTSSASVFGEPVYTPVDEKHPFLCRTIYGATKLCGEGFCHDFGRNGLKYSIVRPYNIYGPRQSPKNGAYSQVVPRWIKCVLRDEPIIVHGDGSQTMDLVYVEDIARAHILALKSEEADGEDFNIGSGYSTSANYLATLITSLMDKHDHPIQHIPSDINVVKVRECDITKAKNILGYNPRYDARKGLKLTVDWWLQQTNIQEAL